MAMALKSKISTPSRFARLRRKQPQQLPPSPSPHRTPHPPLVLHVPHFCSLNFPSIVLTDSRAPPHPRMDFLPPPVVQYILLPTPQLYHPPPPLYPVKRHGTAPRTSRRPR